MVTNQKMMKLPTQEWYFGMSVTVDELSNHLLQPGDFLVRCVDAGNGIELFLSCKCPRASLTTGTTTNLSKENLTQDDSEKVSFVFL